MDYVRHGRKRGEIHLGRRALVLVLFCLPIVVAVPGVGAATTDVDPPTITFTPNPLTPPPSPTGWTAT